MKSGGHHHDPKRLRNYGKGKNSMTLYPKDKEKHLGGKRVGKRKEREKGWGANLLKQT